MQIPYIFLSLFAFSYLLLPMGTFYRLLRIPEGSVSTYSYSLSLIFLGAALVSYFLSNKSPSVSALSKANKSALSPPQTFSKLQFTLLLFLSLTLLVRVLLGIERAFDNDEVDFAINLTKGGTVGPLLLNNTHPFSSYLSLFFTKLFGFSMWSIRLPAVLCCVAFLVALMHFSLRSIPLIPSLLVFGHLASSSIVVWYFHSSRGYAPMILFCFLLFSVVYSVAIQQAKMTRFRWALLIGSLLVIPFTHGFAMIFAGLLPFALAGWIYFNKTSFTAEHRKTLQRLNYFLFAFVPYQAGCLGYMFVETMASNAKYVGIQSTSKYANETLPRAIAMVLGSSHAITLKILILLIATYLFVLIRRRGLTKDLTFWILALFLGAITFQRVALSTYITGRFFLGALPLFVIWLVGILKEDSSLILKGIALPALFITLVAFPILDGKTGLFQLPHDGYHRFMKTARKQLKGVPKNCIDFSYSGEEPSSVEAYIADKYFFSKSPTSTACSKQYQLHFAWPWEVEDTTIDRRVGTIEDLPTGKKYKLIEADGEGRFLAEVETN